MRNRSLTLASCLVVAVMALVSALAASRLPAGAQLPVHWNISGTADGFADASHALAMPGLLTAGISLFFAILPRLEPLQDRMEASAPLLRTCWAALLAIMIVVEITIAGPAFGLRLPSMLPLASTGLVLMVIGNALPKSRPGFFVGIRTPWTLIDADNWVATHRLGAWTMIAGGLILFTAALLPLSVHVRTIAIVAALVTAVVPPVVYSYFFWRRNHGRA